MSDPFASSRTAVAAIDARRSGLFDDPALAHLGPLSTVDADAAEIAGRFLKAQGFIVGPRDAMLNRRHPGAFMVAEAHEDHEKPTEDGSNGPWCIVGDDLPALVLEAFDIWVSEFEHPATPESTAADRPAGA